MKTAHVTLGQPNLQHLKEQERAFVDERAQILEQANDAAETQREITRRNLLEREKVLICPITLELFDFPVVTGCCGKTFSSEGLRQAIRQNPLCPFCRGKLLSSHPNRDVAKLVEIHRRERSVLGITDPNTPTSSTCASQENDPTLSTTTPTSSRRVSGNTRQSRHRHNRSDRIQARSQLPHRRPTTARSALVDAAPDAASSLSQPQERSITPGGLTVSTIGSDGTVTRVLPHMVRSVLASAHFPSARPQSTARGRRQRARTTGRAAPATSPTTSSTSRRRAASAAPRAVSSSIARIASSNMPPSSAPTSASQGTRRVRNSTRAACNTPVADIPASAASNGATSAEVKFTARSAMLSANSQGTKSSGRSSEDLKAWLRALPTATSSSTQATVSSTTALRQPISGIAGRLSFRSRAPRFSSLNS
ncbi:hypothetical protein GN244_ATG09218 [Phytophthora infestans]|nr:hypothetical protein GN244_ATG09218 [Phytophthora infestans]